MRDSDLAGQVGTLILGDRDARRRPGDRPPVMSTRQLSAMSTRQLS